MTPRPAKPRLLVTVPRLERMPTLKDMARDAHTNTMKGKRLCWY